MERSIFLTVLEVAGAAREDVVPLYPGQPVVVGRDPSSDLVIDDAAVSSRHCVFTRQGNEVELLDLGSSNGTWVGGQRVEQQVLVDGDALRLGDSTILLRCADLMPRLIDDTVSSTLRLAILEHARMDQPVPVEDRAARRALEASIRVAGMLARLSEASDGRQRDAILDAVLRIIVTTYEASRGCLALDLDGRLVVVASAGGPEFTVSRTVLDACVRDGRSVHTDRGLTLSIDDSHSLMAQRVKAVLAVPLMADDRPIGAIYLDSLKRSDAFAVVEMRLLTLVGSLIAGGIARFDMRAERRQLEARVEELQRIDALGRVIGGVVHDMGNLLSSIQGQADSLLVDPGAGADDLVDGLSRIREVSGRAGTLSKRLLSIARGPSRGTAELDIAEWLGGLRPALEALAGRGVEVSIMAEEALRIAADPARLEQVIVNLVINARDAMPDGGRLDIAASHEDGAVVLRVSDTGGGVPAEIRSRLFEPFFTTKPPEKGSGLGLATVARIIRDHNGTLTVDEAPGGGACFVIGLPRRDSETGAPPVIDVGTWAGIGRLGGPELQRRMVAAFEGRADARMAALRASLGTDDYASAVHELRGASMQVGAARLAFYLAKARVEEGSRAEQRVEQIAAELSRVRTALAGRVRRRAVTADTAEIPFGGDVALIDDNVEVGEMIGAILGRRFRLLHYTDATSGLAAIRERRPDVLLLDLNLPDADGLFVLGQVRADPALSGLSVVAVSAGPFTGRTSEDALHAAGFDAIIAKPILDGTSLGQVVTRLVRQARRP